MIHSLKLKQPSGKSLMFFFSLDFLSFPFTFSLAKHPSEDDNSEDEWLKSPPSLKWRALGKGICGAGALMFSTQVFSSVDVSSFNFRFRSLQFTLNG